MVSVDSLPGRLKLDLQCNYCLNLLSVPGVEVKLDGYDEECIYVCGRCSDSNDLKFKLATRDHAYEALASIVKFPCRYSGQGCKKQLTWGSVLDHEKCCKHRTFFCMASECVWDGTVENLDIHFRNNHPKFILNKGFFQLPQISVQSFYILYLHSEIFLIEYKYTQEQNSFCMNIKYIGKPCETGRFSCNIILKESKKKKPKTMDVYKGKVKPFRDYGEPQEINTIEIDLNSVRDTLNSLNINCFIYINETIAKKVKKPKELKIDVVNDETNLDENTKRNVVPESRKSSKNKNNSKNESKNSSKNEDKNSSKNENNSTNGNVPTSNDDFKMTLLREIECPVCQDYMLSPIFVCSLGHSVCGLCKTKLKNCPTCSSKFGNARNYTLESMLQLVKFPCQNHLHGCKFNGDVISIQKHRNKCKFECIRCPLSNCDWKGPMELLVIHLKGQHEKNIFLDLEDALTYNLNMGQSHSLVEFEESIFRISCKYSKRHNGIMQWSFRRIFVKVPTNSHKVEIEFLDQTNKNRKFIIDHIFQDLEEKKDIFKDALCIPIRLLQSYISNENMLHFKYKLY